MKKSIVLIMLVFVAMVCSGCINDASDANSNQITATGPMDFQELSCDNLSMFNASEAKFDSFQYIFLMDESSDGFYAYASTKDEPEVASLYYCDLKTERIDPLGYEPIMGTSFLSISASPSGELWAVEYVPDEIDGNKVESYCISIFSDNDARVFAHDEQEFFPLNLIVDEKNDMLYLHCTDASNGKDYIYVYSTQGEQLAEIEMGKMIENIIYSEIDNSLYICVVDNSHLSVFKLNENDFTLEPVLEVDQVTNGRLYANTHANGFFVDMNSVLFFYDLDTEQLLPVIDWIANGLSGTIRFVMPYDDTYIIMRREHTENIDFIIYLTQKDIKQSSITKLSFFTLASDYRVEKAIADFNNSNDQYYIEVTNFYDYGEDGLAKLNVEILSGNIPDIYYLDGMPVDSFAAMGLFENLHSYMKGSSYYDVLWSSAISALYDSGSCYQFVPAFTLNVLFGTPEVIGHMDNLNFSDTLGYLNSNSNESQHMLGNNITPMEFIEYVITCNLSRFVNYETSECFFDGPDFIAVLETVGGFPPYDPAYSNSFNIYRGTQDVAINWIDSVTDIVELYSLFQDNCVTGSLFRDDQNAGIVMKPVYSFAMSSQSDHKAGIWEFLEWFYADNFQQDLGMAIPMRSDIYEDQWLTTKELMEANEIEGYDFIAFDDGVRSEFFVKFSEKRFESYSIIVSLIDGISSVYQVDDVIIDIIYEDIQAYLYGDSSAADTAALIQNRVQTYLHENA